MLQNMRLQNKTKLQTTLMFKIYVVDLGTKSFAQIHNEQRNACQNVQNDRNLASLQLKKNPRSLNFEGNAIANTNNARRKLRLVHFHWR